MSVQTADIAYEGDVFIPAFPGLVDQETFSILRIGTRNLRKSA